MPLNVVRLRRWFAVATVLVIALVAGVYLYTRYRVQQAILEAPKKLGIDVQQSAEGWVLSKSEGDRTLFTVRASRAVQFREGGRAELKDVNIIMYGRKADRFDQIQGSDFLYDPATKEITARGDVHIDLEAYEEGPQRPDQAPPLEQKNPIHLKTSGLVFNHETGMAKTGERIEFRLPQASGSAVGAVYDANAMQLDLLAQVAIKTTGEGAADIAAKSARIQAEERQALLRDVEVEQGDRTLNAGEATIFLDERSNVERVVAKGNVRASEAGEESPHNQNRVVWGTRASSSIRAASAEFLMNERGRLKSANLSGGVEIEQRGAQAVTTGKSARAVLEFAGENQLVKARALGGVTMRQAPQNPAQGQTVELTAETTEFHVRDGRRMERATTGGASRIRILSAAAQGVQATETVVTAGRFVADFDQRNRIRSLRGEPNARIESQASGQPLRTSTSRQLTVAFNAQGEVASLVQEGNVRYREGTREASAERARFEGASDSLQLSGGQPRITEGGLTVSAQNIRLARRTGELSAEGEVKSTYIAVKDAQPGAAGPHNPAAGGHSGAAGPHNPSTADGQPGTAPLNPSTAGGQPGTAGPHDSGGMFSGGDPIHVTAQTLAARQATGTARYTGSARLWQGANIVQAPVIEFNRERRTLVAQGSEKERVTTVFTQAAEQGKPTPVNVTAGRLTYTDAQRKARFERDVVLKGADSTVTAASVEVFLAQKSAANAPAAAASASTATSGSVGTPALGTPSQLERVVAEGGVTIEQPGRKATGEKLVYTASDGKFVMTGGPPSIFDAEQGKITGDSLTFYSRNDRVTVGSGSTSRTVTQTRVER
jgi:lipopolysaccharide export system protein LptA